MWEMPKRETTNYCQIGHYHSAPTPGGQESEGATCILYIEIAPLSDPLSALTQLSTQLLPTKEES
jgi:hypothetical protein